MARPPKKWYVFNVRPRHEKTADKLLKQQEYETWLPLQRTLRKWSDRKKYVDEPVFRGYIFVKAKEVELPKVAETDSVIRVISFEGKPEPVPENEMKNIRKILEGDHEVEITESEFQPGVSVKVIFGPLCGLEGELVKLKGKHRVAFNVKHFDKTMLIEVPIKYLEVDKNSNSDETPIT